MININNYIDPFSFDFTIIDNRVKYLVRAFPSAVNNIQQTILVKTIMTPKLREEVYSPSRLNDEIEYWMTNYSLIWTVIKLPYLTQSML